jgi:hypothetical protein
MMLGSCFTDNIGKMLSDYGFDVCVNPFGALYNPVSVLNSIERLACCRKFTEEDCVKIGAGDERICSFHHHTSFARESAEEFLSEANEALQKASEYFLASNRIIITLGTSWCFRHISKDFIVSNCLKHPAAEFRRERMSVQEVAEALRRITGLSIPGMKPKEFIFTVSPIRHFKDGAHGNQISKSTLLLGIEDVLEDCRADYFPAYEIVNDELRDYRFYAEDMCHPSDQTIRYIFERFVSWALPASEHQTLEQNIKAYLRRQHRQQHI